MEEQKPHRNRWGKRLIYFAVLFAFQEVVFRFFFPIPELSNFDRINYLKLNPEDHEEVTFARNQTWDWQSQLDTAHIFYHYMNQYGFRDEEWKVEKKADQKRYLFIGDSFVEGLMADQGQTFPDHFEKSAGQNSEVMNAGMLGVGLDAYLQLAADMVPTFKPDVVFLCIFSNDLGQTEPAVPQFFLEPENYNPFQLRLVEFIQQWQSHGPLKFRWDGSSKNYLPLVGTPTNLWTNHEHELKTQVIPEAGEMMKDGRFNPFRVNVFMEEERKLQLNPKLGETVPFFQYICQQNGATPVIVYLPSRNQITQHYYPYELKLCLLGCDESFDLTQPKYQLHQQVLAKQCEDFGVPFIDLTPLLQAQEARGNHLYWNYDDHFNAKGYQLVGEYLWQAWSQSGR